MICPRLTDGERDSTTLSLPAVGTRRTVAVSSDFCAVSVPFVRRGAALSSRARTVAKPVRLPPVSVAHPSHDTRSVAAAAGCRPTTEPAHRLPCCLAASVPQSAAPATWRLDSARLGSQLNRGRRGSAEFDSSPAPSFTEIKLTASIV